jgi:hypothetical protein
MIKHRTFWFAAAAIVGLVIVLVVGSPGDVGRVLGMAIIIGAIVIAAKRGRCRNCR